jgi:hypothetical protein
MTMKRLNYFKGQFLQEDDFKDEQKYHIESHRLHNKNLHNWGIVNGLNVTIGEDKKSLDISKGMAIDREGRQIILEEEINVEISKPSKQIFYLTIRYDEKEERPDECGTGKKTRVEEWRKFEQISKPDEKSTAIVLAKITMNPETETIKEIEKINLKHGGIGHDQIEDGSVSISKMKYKHKDGASGSSSLNPADPSMGEKGEEIADTVPVTPDEYPKKNHRFFITSVIPTSQDSIIKWWWEVENTGNEIKYILKVKNLSDKIIDYHYKYYEIQES